jgi:glycosyltransferase involved in cell wall biosynthesis
MRSHEVAMADSRAIIAVGPRSGGVGDVFGGTVAALRAQGRAVVEERPREDGSAALSAGRSVWRLRRQLRRRPQLLVEFGSNDLAAFWFAVLVTTIRRDVLVVAHDPPKLAHAPGAGLIRRDGKWGLRVAYRVLSPALDRRLVAHLMRHAGAIVVLGEQARADLLKRTQRPVLSAPHGLHRWTAPTAAPSSCSYVLFAGFIAPSKGLDLLIEAWASMEADSLRLLIAGSAGPSHAAWARDLQLESERFANAPEWLGAIVGEEAFNALFGGAAVVVLPYRTSSPASGILVRAMAAGRCVVASRVPACTEALEDGTSGLLVDIEDAGGLERALKRVAVHPEERDRFGQAAADRAAALFGWDRFGSVIQQGLELARS